MDLGGPDGGSDGVGRPAVVPGQHDGPPDPEPRKPGDGHGRLGPRHVGDPEDAEHVVVQRDEDGGLAGGPRLREALRRPLAHVDPEFHHEFHRAHGDPTIVVRGHDAAAGPDEGSDDQRAGQGRDTRERVPGREPGEQHRRISGAGPRPDAAAQPADDAPVLAPHGATSFGSDPSAYRRRQRPRWSAACTPACGLPGLSPVAGRRRLHRCHHERGGAP